MKITIAQRTVLARLQFAARAVYTFKTRQAQTELEDAIADMIAEGRLVAEKLKLNRKRMTERVNARLEKELA